MFKIARDVRNSDSSSTEILLVFDQNGLKITATGPAGEQSLQLTQIEAENLYELLTMARPAYKEN